MNKNSQSNHDYLKDLFVAIFILALINIRRLNLQKKVNWIGLVTFLGVLIALGDLFYECLYTYRRHRHELKMIVFLLLCLVCSSFLLYTAAKIYTGVIVLTEAQNDICTLLALLITLPHSLYVKLLGLLLFGKDEK